VKKSIILNIIPVFAISLVLLSGSITAAHAITIVQNSTPMDLVDEISGSGITIVGVPTLAGGAVQSGTFSDGMAEVGMETGIVLHSGDVAMIAGPNGNAGLGFPETLFDGLFGDDDVSTAVGSAGDADLDVLTGAPTFDASVLEFSFQFGDGSVGGDLEFMFTFASEEYIDFINSAFNDGFLLNIDGTNVGTNTGMVGGDPVTVNTINNALNSGMYINNVANTNAIPNANLDIKYDGLTTVITANVLGLGPGVHTAKFAVADATDMILDAGVFIEGDSFAMMKPKTAVGGEFIPIDATAVLIAGLAGNMSLLVPIVVGIAGVGAYFVRKSMNKE